MKSDPTVENGTSAWWKPNRFFGIPIISIEVAGVVPAAYFSDLIGYVAKDMA